MHILIVGEQGVGKSTLIRRILAELKLPVYGMETGKADRRTELGEPVYLHEIGKPYVMTEENRIGYCGNKVYQRFPAAFDRFAHTLRDLPDDGIILLDELGTLENGAEEFCDTVLNLLYGKTPVIAAVKHKDTPFLQRVRAHKNAKCFYLTPENRDALFAEIMEFIKAQG